MFTNMERFIIFVTMCFTARLLIAYVAKNLKKSHNKYAIVVAIMIASGFLYNYIIKKSKGGFGQKVWWNNYRLIHSIMFYLFAYMTYFNESNAYKILVIDAIMGLLFSIHHHFF